MTNIKETMGYDQIIATWQKLAPSARDVWIYQTVFGNDPVSAPHFTGSTRAVVDVQPVLDAMEGAGYTITYQKLPRNSVRSIVYCNDLETDPMPAHKGICLMALCLLT